MSSAIYLAIGLLFGGIAGWFLCLGFGSKSPSPDNRLENELRQQLAQREAELAKERAWADEASSARANALARCEAYDQLLAQQRQSHADSLLASQENQSRALLDLREAFKALSADALKQTQPEFLRLAQETLGRFQETAKGDLAQRQQSIATLVEPLKSQLATYQQRLQQSEQAQLLTLGEVRKHLEMLALQSQSLSSETHQLRRVLSSNQARGRWGEETLRRVVEAAGLSAHCDFTEQTQSGDSKPDLLVRLPGNRLIIVDAKVPDLDFLGALETADGPQRERSLAEHAAKLKETIRALGARDYPREFPQALDHVVLFLPAESLFSAALEGDRDLIVWAASKQIMLATPASLIALLRSVSVSWQQHAQSENAQAIAEAAREFYSRVVRFSEHFESLRGGLDRANKAYNEAVGSYERMVRPSGDKLAHLGGGSPGKDLAELPGLGGHLRLPSPPPAAFTTDPQTSASPPPAGRLNPPV